MIWANLDRYLQPKTQKVWGMFFLMLVFTFTVAAGSAFLFRWRNMGTAYDGQPLSIIILGKDSRGSYHGNLTDAMILLTVNPKLQKVSMLSIPRDTRVISPGETRERKINSVYKEEGGKPGELLRKTLESIYGIPVNYYLTFNFDGFRQVIDLLGGIEVNVDKRMIYHDPTDGTVIDLQQGLQTLSGEKALEFVRHRHDDRGQSYYSSDFDRNRRQQVVIKAVVKKIESLNGLFQAYRILRSAGNNIQTNLSLNQLAGLTWDFSNVNRSNLDVIKGNGQFWNHGASFVIIPKSTLDAERKTLQQTMGQHLHEVYNNSPSGAY